MVEHGNTEQHNKTASSDDIDKKLAEMWGGKYEKIYFFKTAPKTASLFQICPMRKSQTKSQMSQYSVIKT